MKPFKPEIFFSIILLFFGVVLVFITPIGAGYDEDTHLGRIWEMSKGVLVPNQYLSKGPLYPYAFYELSYRQDVNLNPVSWDGWKAQLGQKIDWNNMINHITRSIYFPTLYLPQAFIMGIFGRVLDTPVAIIYYLIRLSYLFTYALLSYLTIRTAPFGKWLLGILSITPMALVQASTITVDAISNGGGFLFIAWVLYLNTDAKKDTFSWKDWAITSVLVLFICTLKINNIPLLLLLFLIPRPKFGTQKQLLGFILAALVSVIVVFIGWNLLTSTNLNAVSHGDSSPIQLLKGIFTDPLHFLNAFFYNFQTQYLRYYIEWIGVSGYAYWDMPAPVYWIFPILMVLAILMEGCGTILSSKKRAWLVILFAAFYVETVTIFYLLDSVSGSILIPDIKGRYFIAGAPLLLLALFFPRRLINLNRWWLQGGVIAISLIATLGLFLVYHVTCGSSFYTSGPCILPNYKNWAPETAVPVTLSGPVEVQQTFTVKSNNLDQIKVWINTNNPAETGAVSIQILDAATQRVVFYKTYAQADIPASGWLDSRFAPISASKDKAYLLKITPLDSQVRQDIEVSYYPSNQYLDGRFILNGDKKEGDLLFQYGCKGFLE